MVLELHVWGPAFSLPSIDAQCLAAIAYFSQALPKTEWCLIASNDPSLSPSKELPALRNENVWVGGFRNIVDYLTKVSDGEWSLDSGLEGRQKADVIAYSSFVEVNGQSLLDLSLFVSSRNYTTVIRPLYSAMLPLPMPYITPPALRSAAKIRTAHLNLSALDVDATEAEVEKKDEQNPIPPHLRTPSNTLSNILFSTPEANILIRLDALACSFLDSLHSLRGKKRFFVGQRPTSLDCLAFAYLALALLPDLPSPWLAKCIRTKYPQLSACVHDLQRMFFAGAVVTEDAYRPSGAGHAQLPWIASQDASIGALMKTFVAAIGDKIPLISSLRETATLERKLEEEVNDEDDEDKDAVAKYVTSRRREIWLTAGTIAMGLGLFIGFVSYFNVLGVAPLGFGFLGPGAVTRSERKQKEENSGLSRFGEAGEALGALLGSQESESTMPPPPPPGEFSDKEKVALESERTKNENTITDFFKEKIVAVKNAMSGLF